MKKLALFVLLILPLHAFAEYNFNHVSLNVTDDELEVSGLDFEGNGFGIGVSREFGDEMFFLGSYGTSTVEYSDSVDEAEIEGSAISLGVGKYFEVGQGKAVIGAGISRVDVELSINGVDFGSDDDSGVQFFVGYILSVSDQFDLLGQINRSEIGDGSTSFGVTASLDVSDAFAIEAFFSDGEDSQTLGLGARINMD